MPRVPVDINFSDIRDEYLKVNKGNGVTHTQYTNFVKDVNLAIVNYVLEGNILHLPHGLGRIYIEKYVPKKRTKEVNGKPVPNSSYVDFHKTMQLRREVQPNWDSGDWKKLPLEDRLFVMYDNSHSQDYVYHIVWEKKGCPVKNAYYYNFKPIRKEFKHGLRDMIRDDNVTTPAYYDKR